MKTDQILKINIIAGIFIINISVAYYFFIALPKHNREKLALKERALLLKEAKLTAQQKEQLYNQKLLDTCLKDAYTDYKNNWATTCIANGFTSNCNLPKELAEATKKTYEEGKNFCFKRYPIQ